MRRVPVIAAVVVIAGLGAGTTLPKTAVAPIVAERQASMKAMASAAKTISGIFDGKLSYDAAAFKAAAETIRRRSGSAMVDAFPADSLGEPSAAKAEIGQSREEFAALARRLESLATALSDAADDAPDGITEAMRMKPGMAMGSSLLGSGLAAWPSPILRRSQPNICFTLCCRTARTATPSSGKSDSKCASTSCDAGLGNKDSKPTGTLQCSSSRSNNNVEEKGGGGLMVVIEVQS